MVDDTDPTADKVAPNLRTFLVLEVLGQSSRPMTATEINAELKLPKQTIHRLCATMEHAGLIARDPGGRRYRPAPRARLMASDILAASHGTIPRHTILRGVARATGETVNLVIQADQGMVYLDRIETDWPFRVQLPVGTHVPFHCTASGKVFLASLPDETQRSLVRALDLERLTPNTITCSDDLLTELATIRRQGYALDREEFIEGMAAIAVPILNERGRFLAALATHGPVLRFGVNEALARRPTLIEAAARLAETVLD